MDIADIGRLPVDTADIGRAPAIDGRPPLVDMGGATHKGTKRLIS